MGKKSDSDFAKLDSEFAIAAYETGSVNVNQANKFTTQIQVDALEAGAGSLQSLKFTTQMQVDALKLGADPEDALSFDNEAHMALFETGLYTAKEVIKIERDSIDKLAQTLFDVGKFENEMQRDAFATGKITVTEAASLTNELYAQALQYPSVTSFEDALLVTKPVHLDALKVQSSIPPALIKGLSSYMAVSLMATHEYTEDELANIAKVKNFYSYKLLKADYTNITSAEALNINNWYKYQAFMTGRVNATAAAEFNGPKYELLQTTGLTVDEILRFDNFNQTKAYKTEKIPVEQALEINNFCQIMTLRMIRDPDLSLVMDLSFKCYIEITSDYCKIVDLNDYDPIIQGECTPEFTF